MIDYTGRSILVTGGAGFIGSHLVEELIRRNAHVTVVDNLSTGYHENLVSIIDRVDLHILDLRRDDLRPLLKAQHVDTIFHLAGNASVPASVEAPFADLEANVLGTFNVLEAVRATAPQPALINTSTAAIYGEGVRMPIREDDAAVPVSPYGVSKMAAERYVTVYAGLHALRTASLRLFTVYGPRLRKQVVYDLMRKIQQNPLELFIYGDGSQVRDFNHVANVVEAFLVVADRAPLRGEVYNVAGEESISIQALAQMLCAQMGVEPRLVYSGEVRPGDTQRWFADIARLKALGYRPRVGMVEGLADTLAWFHHEAAHMEGARIA